MDSPLIMVNLMMEDLEMTGIFLSFYFRYVNDIAMAMLFLTGLIMFLQFLIRYIRGYCSRWR